MPTCLLENQQYESPKVQTLKDQIKTLNGRIDRLRARLAKKVMGAPSTLARMRDEVEGMRQLVSSLQQSIAPLTNEMAPFRACSDGHASSLSTLRQEFTSLKEEIRKSKRPNLKPNNGRASKTTRTDLPQHDAAVPSTSGQPPNASLAN